MDFGGAGDLSRLLRQQSHYSGLKNRIDTLGQELATGRKANLGTVFGGDFAPLAGIEHRLSQLASFDIAAKEADTFASTMQSSLETIATLTIDSGTGILLASQGDPTAFAEAASADAEQALRGIVGALNTQFGDRSIFAGQATDRPAIASVDDIVATIRPLLAGLTTAQDVIDTVDAWFAVGGDFETQGYLGDTALAPLQIGPSVSANIAITAEDERLRSVLASFTIGILAGDAVNTLDTSEQVDLLTEVGMRLTVEANSIANLQADLGAIQAQIETAKTTNQSEVAALELSRVELLSADPFETASNFESAQTQLETFYAVMVRMSDLSLVNFLR